MLTRRDRLTARLATVLSVAVVSTLLSSTCGREPAVEKRTPQNRPEKSSSSNPSRPDQPSSASGSSPPEAASSPPVTVYNLGLTSADVDTAIESYLETPGGITEQCEVLNELVSTVCCSEFEIGCNVRYACDLLSVDPNDRMTGTAYLYQRETSGEPNYALHHGSVLTGLTKFLRTLQLYGTVERKLPVAYTRHAILLDDEETRVRSNKIDRSDPAFLLLGSVLPGRSERGGTRLRLNFYASRDGMLLSVAPNSRSSLTQAVAEYRASLFSLHGKQLTGRGSRDLFEYSREGVVPRLSACQALAIESPAHLRRFLPDERRTRELE